ncbi:MAG: type II toxin-antitoxin system VapC family toxin [Planctomycetota bacterium]
MIPAYHAGYVLDASVVAKWFLLRDEPDRARAVALRDMHVSGKIILITPDLALLEVLNAIRFSGRAGEAEGAAALEALTDLSLRVEPLHPDVLRKANAIAWAYGITLYDALYVALAEQVGYPLVTADGVMVKKLRGHKIVLKLADLDFE